MKFDDITKQLGEFGLYQKRLYFLVCLPAAAVAIQLLVSVFTLAVPRHRCIIPGFPNDTFTVQNEYHELLINQTIPQTTEDEDVIYDSCHYYTVDNITDLNDQLPQNSSLIACNAWVYDRSVFQTTFITEHDFVCGSKVARSHANMVLMAGILVGTLLFGILGDIFGRRKSLMIAVVLFIGSSIGQAFAPNFTALVVLRFITGGSGVGSYIVTFVVAMELVGPSKRMLAGLLFVFFFCGGLYILLIFAYFIRDWSYLQMAVSFPNILMIAYIWIIPESARWLWARGRNKEAIVIIEKAARVNQVTLSGNLLDQIESEEKQESILSIFKSLVMLFRLIVIYFNWCVMAMVYFGLALNVGNLGGDIYINFFLGSTVEALAYGMCVVLRNRVGRKVLYCGPVIAGGLACMATVLSVLYGGKSLHWITIALTMTGKFGVSAAFAIMYIWTTELLPTATRVSGLGSSCMLSRIGGILSPYIAFLGTLVTGSEISTALPLIVFGSTAVVAGSLALVLPETIHTRLPDTLEDAINLNKRTSRGKHQIPEDDRVIEKTE